MKRQKLTRKDKMNASKQGVCWKCGRKLKGKQILCNKCQGKEDEKEWES